MYDAVIKRVTSALAFPFREKASWKLARELLATGQAGADSTATSKAPA